MSDLKDIVDPLDRPVWGAEAIGRVIDRTEGQAFHILNARLVDADKVGGLTGKALAWHVAHPLARGDH